MLKQWFKESSSNSGALGAFAWVVELAQPAHEAAFELRIPLRLFSRDNLHLPDKAGESASLFFAHAIVAQKVDQL